MIEPLRVLRSLEGVEDEDQLIDVQLQRNEAEFIFEIEQQGKMEFILHLKNWKGFNKEK